MWYACLRIELKTRSAVVSGVEPVGFLSAWPVRRSKLFPLEIERFDGRDVVLKNGESIRPDLIVFGTGFRQRLPFLSLQYQQRITNSKGMFSLYRNILHPDLPQMGFVGFNSSLFTTVTSEVAANWLAATVADDLILPPADEMFAEMDRMEKMEK